MSSDMPLVHDPNRDASASIRGYVYQIYQSVFTWVTMDSEEVLFLERAEDFDVHSSVGVTTTQVKDTPASGNMTLRSHAVQEAISNFIQHIKKNPSVNLKFRFLATCEAGSEQGDPFLGVKGLDYWGKVVRKQADPITLIAFLKNVSIHENVKKYLNENETDFIVNNLIANMSWDLGEKSSDGIKLGIEKHLADFGYKISVNYSNSIKVLDHLLVYCADLITKPGVRQLCKNDFIREFNNFTMESVPKQEITDLRSQSNALMRALLGQHLGNDDSLRLASVLSAPIPATKNEINRTKLLNQLCSVLASLNGIILHGSTGLGKSSLARSICEKIAKCPGWCDFRGLSNAQISSRMEAIVHELVFSNNYDVLVLDDLDVSDSSGYIASMLRLSVTLRECGISLVITSPLPASSELLNRLWLEENANQSVPYFTESEVEHLLVLYSNDAGIAHKFARYVYLTTTGHPQLVNARARRLDRLGWNQPIDATLFETTDFESIRRDAQKRLLSEFPDDETRELAYRLSIAFGNFKRKFAIGIGEIDPIIRRPGEAFSSLLGPWIESVATDRYRISPLLSDAYKSLYSDEVISSLHEYASLSPLSEKTLNPQEASNGLAHAFLSKSEKAATTWAYVLTQSSFDPDFRSPAVFDWFASMALEPAKPLWEGNAHLDLMLRIAQFKIASGLRDQSRCGQIIQNIVDLINGKSFIENQEMTEMMAYGIILNTIDIEIRPSISLHMITRLIEISKKGIIALDDIASKMRDTPFGLSAFQLLFLFESARIYGVRALEDFLDSFDALPAEIKTELTPVFITQGELDFSNSLLSNSWLKDVQRDSLEPGYAVTVFQKARNYGIKWGLPRFSALSVIAESIILDEYLKDADLAIAVVETQLQADGPDVSELLLQAGKVCMHRNDHVRALKYFNKGFKSYRIDTLDAVFAYRNAGISAGSIDNWRESAEYFIFASEIAKNRSSSYSLHLGLLADGAYSLWRSGDHTKSIELLDKVVIDLERIPPGNSLKNKHVNATVGHLLGWIWPEAQGRVTPAEMMTPAPGMCSNQEPSEALKDHRLVPLPTVKAMIQGIARILDLKIITSFDSTAEEALPWFAFTIESTVNLVRLKDGKDLDLAIPILMETERVMSLRQHLTNREDWVKPQDFNPVLPPNYWETRSGGKYFQRNLIACSIIYANKITNGKLPIQAWADSLDISKLSSFELSKFLDLLSGNRNDPDESLEEQCAWSISRMLNGGLLLRDLYIVHFKLYNILHDSDCAWLASEAFTELLSKTWSTIAREQTFALVAPMIYCPEILAACESSNKPALAKIANILRALAPALAVNLSPEAQKVLSEDIAARNI